MLVYTVDLLDVAGLAATAVVALGLAAWFGLGKLRDRRR